MIKIEWRQQLIRRFDGSVLKGSVAPFLVRDGFALMILSPNMLREVGTTLIAAFRCDRDIFEADIEVTSTHHVWLNKWRGSRDGEIHIMIVSQTRKYIRYRLLLSPAEIPSVIRVLHTCLKSVTFAEYKKNWLAISKETTGVDKDQRAKETRFVDREFTEQRRKVGRDMRRPVH